MMRSLSSAVAGLRTHQTKMDVIGNNIANVNTYGFKASRTTFADVYYQNLSGGRSGSTGTRGGTNPTQIGYGSSVATIDVMQDVSSAAATGKPLDVYITGEGFLVSKDASGQTYYSRLGNMTFDDAGNLVDGNGNRIMGFPMNADGTPNISADGTVSGDRLQGIWLDPALFDKIKSITISNSGAITGLLDGDQQVTANTGAIPGWLNGNTLSIPANSTYKGTINLAISGFCSNDTMAIYGLGLNAGDVTSMEMGNLALPESNNYKVSVDQNGNVTMHLDAEPANGIPNAIDLTGSYKNGKIVLANKNGDVGLIINLDTEKVKSLSPTYVTEPTANFNTSTNVGAPRVAWIDKDGNRLDKNGQIAGPKATTVYVMPTTDSALMGTPPIPLYVQDQAAVPGVYDPIDDGDDNPLFYDPDNTATVPTADYFPWYDKDGNWKEDDNGNRLYAKLILDGAPGDEAYKEVTAPQPATYKPLLDNGQQMYAAHATAANNYPHTLPLTLYQQMTTTDKGENIIKFPNPPEEYQVPAEYPQQMTFGELTFDITGPVDPMGFNNIIGTAEPGEPIVLNIGNLVLAKFRNPSGLDQAGTSYFAESLNSGEPVYVVPGLEGTGGLKSNYLEQSNVDISKEFTDMITTQRGFQANSRIITVSDEMLQELVNLKR